MCVILISKEQAWTDHSAIKLDFGKLAFTLNMQNSTKKFITR